MCNINYFALWFILLFIESPSSNQKTNNINSYSFRDFLLTHPIRQIRTSNLFPERGKFKIRERSSHIKLRIKSRLRLCRKARLPVLLLIHRLLYKAATWEVPTDISLFVCAVRTIETSIVNQRDGDVNPQDGETARLTADAHGFS